MPTQGIAETECTLTLQSQGHVASNMHSGLGFESQTIDFFFMKEIFLIVI